MSGRLAGRVDRNRLPEKPLMMDRQKEADAAFFEDWSQWSVLDGLPLPPERGCSAAARRDYSRYYCELRLGPGWIGGPYFVIAVPNRNPQMTICRRLPGARQHPGLHGLHRVALSGLDGTWYVPAEQWRAVRAALPDLQRLTTAFCASNR